MKSNVSTNLPHHEVSIQENFAFYDALPKKIKTALQETIFHYDATNIYNWWIAMSAQGMTEDAAVAEIHRRAK